MASLKYSSPAMQQRLKQEQAMVDGARNAMKPTPSLDMIELPPDVAEMARGGRMSARNWSHHYQYRKYNHTPHGYRSSYSYSYRPSYGGRKRYAEGGKVEDNNEQDVPQDVKEGVMPAAGLIAMALYLALTDMGYEFPDSKIKQLLSNYKPSVSPPSISPVSIKSIRKDKTNENS